MAFFKKKMSDKDFKMMLEAEAREQREAMLNMNNLNLPNDNTTQKKAPMVLTADELLGVESTVNESNKQVEVDNIEMNNETSTEDFLFKKMLEAREEQTVKATTPPVVTEPTVKEEPKEEVKEEPAFYQLESVEEILRRMEEKANQKVNSRYGYNAVINKKEEPIVSSPVKQEVSSAMDSILEEVKEPKKEEKKSDFNVESLINDMKADIGIYDDNTDKKAKDILEETYVDETPEVKETVTETAINETIEQVLEPDAKEVTQIINLNEIKIEENDNLQQENDALKDIISDEEFIDAEDLTTSEVKKEKVDANLGATNIFTKVTEPESFEDISSDYEEDDEEETEEVFEEYTNIDDKEKTLKFINKGKIFSIISLLLGGFSTIFALLGEFVFNENGLTFLTVSSILFALAVVLNLNLLKSFIKMFTGKLKPDFAVATVSILAVVYNFMAIYLPELRLFPLFLATTIPLVVTEIVRLSKYARINRSFNLIANNSYKNALVFAEDEKAKLEAAKLANFEETNICLSKKAKNILSFVTNTFKSESSGFTVGVVSLFGLAFAIAAAVSGFLSESISPITAFMAVLLFAATPTTTFIVELPLKLANKRLKFYDSAIFGEKSADILDSTNCINIDIADVFPEGTVKLIDFKLLSPNPIDQTLLDAAALTKVAKSPLAGIFKQITDETAEQKELPVDTVVYEERMGISGWVDDRRVFVGNRTLMEAHGFRVPSLEVDKKVLQRGYFPVYLGTENVLCALLIVKYTAHPDVALELKRLTSTGTNILIHNCDQNVTGEMVEDYLGLYDDTVYITTRSLQKALNKEKEEAESVETAAIVGDNVCGLASTITAAIKIKKISKVISLLYVILTLCLMAALVVALFMGQISLISSLTITAGLVASILIEALPPYISRP